MNVHSKHVVAVNPQKKCRPFNIRFDDEDYGCLVALVSFHKLTKSDIMRIAIRRMHEDDLIGRTRG